MTLKSLAKEMSRYYPADTMIFRTGSVVIVVVAIDLGEPKDAKEAEADFKELLAKPIESEA